MPSSLLAAAALAVAIILVPLAAYSGDEADYSAPYLTVEDGELVTKYPAKEHQGDAPQTEASVTDTAESTQQTTDPTKRWLIVAVVITVAVALLSLLTRRQRRSRTAD